MGVVAHPDLPQSVAFDDHNEQPPREECGVFGLWAPGEEVAKLTYFGLFALQHRGQEAAGIATGDGQQVVVYKDLGLVSQIFDESTLESLRGDVAVGHTRYSTAGGVMWENSQPMFRVASDGTDIALCHNGNVVNYLELMQEAADLGLVNPATEPSDSDVMTALLAHGIAQDADMFQAMRNLLPRIRGAFCLTITEGSTLYAARDPWGIRPLVLGRLEKGWAVASETCALDIIGASFVREIEPGEMVAISGAGVHSERFAAPQRKTCVFEYVYLARPDSTIHRRNVNATRLEIGRRLAREHYVDADLVIPVPESGNPAAVGYAQESGIPFGQGLVKNAYVGRTFIQPSDTLRQLGIRLKLNPLREVIQGKRLVVVDDSIVRGNTQRALIRMLREAGVAEVHVRIASPPVKWPCFYGIDFASPGELIANAVAGNNEAEMVQSVCTALGADSLGYVSIPAMIAATEQAPEDLCCACFDGEYPVGMPAGNKNAELVSAMKRGSCGGVAELIE